MSKRLCNESGCRTFMQLEICLFLPSWNWPLFSSKEPLVPGFWQRYVCLPACVAFELP